MSRSYEDLWREPERSERGPLRIVTSGDTTPYARAALAEECERVLAAPAGERNHALNTAAYRMGQIVGANELDLDEARAALWQAGDGVGLPSREVELCLRLDRTGGLVKGQDEPRSISPLTPITTSTRSFEEDPVPPKGDRARESSSPVDHPGAGGDQDPDQPRADEATDEPERTSWFPRDLGPVLRGEVADLVPTHLARTDGSKLLYPGKVNGLIGPSESGKSWVMFLAIAQALRDGETAFLLDFEDDLAGAVRRLRLLGVDDEALACRFHYADPDEALDVLARRDLAATLREHGPTIIGVDGVNAAMSLLGYNPDKNADATAFAQRLLRPLASSGASVVTVDHVTKNANPDGTRTPGAVGAQAKRAMMDGAAIAVDVVAPFGIGQTGRLRLKIDKDRHGSVRGYAHGGTALGEAVLTSTAPCEQYPRGHVELHIEPHTRGLTPEEVASHDPYRDTLVRERVSKLLEDVEGTEGADPPSGRAIEAAVAGKSAKVRDAILWLTEHGYASRHGAARGAGFRYRTIRPYREAPASFDEDEAAHEGADRAPEGTDDATPSTVRPEVEK